MKLVISFDELSTFDSNCDISNYWELLEQFIAVQFPNWDMEEAFNCKTLEYDEINKEVSIEIRTI